MTRVALVDYGAGNLLSIGQALSTLGADVRTARRGAELEDADLLVMPGVGASGPAMARLRRTGLAAGLADAVRGGAWYLGICLGMQLLFGRSEEDGAAGLEWIEGDVRAIPDAPRLPHVGWNEVETAGTSPLFEGVGPLAPMYFVHSYAPVPADPAIVVAETEHGGRFASAVADGRLLGVQFHPEKSGRDGLQVLSNVLRMVAAAGSSSEGIDTRDAPHPADPGAVLAGPPGAATRPGDAAWPDDASGAPTRGRA